MGFASRPSWKRSCHASLTPLSRKPSRVSLRRFFATCGEDVSKGLVARVDDFEIDLTGVLVDGVSTEVSSLAQSIWLVAESLLLATFGLEDEVVALETSGLGDKNCLSGAAFKVTSEWGSCLIGSASDLQFVAREGLFSFADKDSIDCVTDFLTQKLSVVVSTNFE